MSSDLQSRASRLAGVQRTLQSGARTGNGELAAAFVAAIFPDLPESIVEQPDEALVARQIEAAYEFVVHTVAPPVQAYRGAPGLHVDAHNPTTRK